MAVAAARAIWSGVDGRNGGGETESLDGSNMLACPSWTSNEIPLNAQRKNQRHRGVVGVGMVWYPVGRTAFSRGCWRAVPGDVLMIVIVLL